MMVNQGGEGVFNVSISSFFLVEGSVSFSAGLSLGAFGKLAFNAAKLAKDPRFKKMAKGFEEFLDPNFNRSLMSGLDYASHIFHFCFWICVLLRLLFKGKNPASWISVDIGFSAGAQSQSHLQWHWNRYWSELRRGSCVAYLSVGLMATVNVPFLSPVARWIQRCKR